jgi:hypothetical protein
LMRCGLRPRWRARAALEGGYRERVGAATAKTCVR